MAARAHACVNAKTLRGGSAPMTISRFSTPVLLGRIALLVLFLSYAYPLLAKRKDDVVVMKNGDKFTGEIKSLQYGELIFKSDYMKDSVHLDWKRVETLQSQDKYIVSLGDGHRVMGTIRRTTVNEGKQQFTIATDD